MGDVNRGRALAAGLVLAGLAAAAAGSPSPAGAATVHRRFDFEQPGYGRPGRNLSDHFLLEVAGVWHLFYTELPSATVGLCRIGHATSTDLVRWDERPTVITAVGTGWLGSTWAPHVVARPGGGWILLYTGRNAAGAQAICGLASADLDTWSPVAPDPLWTPAAAPWAAWSETETSSCRDPFVWYENGGYSMLYTARERKGRPAIGHARSTDLLAWTDAGPFAVDSTSSAPTDLESPHLAFDAGRVDLLYSRYWTRLLSASSSAGPWNVSAESSLDPTGVAPELVTSGAVRLFSRLRYDECDAPTSLIVIDSVTATAGGYVLPPEPRLSFGWRQEGDAFAGGPAYGDGPAHRGDVPAAPSGLRWMGSGETYTVPGNLHEPCVAPSRDSHRGWLRSPRFTSLGDSLWFRIMGAASPESAFVRLLDACTGQVLASRTGPETSALVPAAWPTAAWRGWPVELELVDQLDRPGGVIGADAFLDSTMGAFVAPQPVGINQTAPAGGENLVPGTTFTVRWASYHPAGVDSHVVFVSWDDFATPPIRLQRRNGNQFSWNWTVPPGPRFTARIRIVAYAKNGVHDCDTSPPFSIAATTDAPGDGPAGDPADLRLAALGSPGATPTLEWGAPAGTRAWLRLYDVRGRVVRTLVAGEAAADPAPRRVAWDGRDGQGRPAPSGLYFALLSGADGRGRRVTVVRLAP